MIPLQEETCLILLHRTFIPKAKRIENYSFLPKSLSWVEQALKKESYSNYTLTTFENVFNLYSNTIEDKPRLLEGFSRMLGYSPEEVSSCVKAITPWIVYSQFRYITMEKYGSNDTNQVLKIMGDLKELEISFDDGKFDDETLISKFNFTEEKALLENPIQQILSSFDFINSSTPNRRGYIKGSLTCFAGPASGGKSMAMMQEVGAFLKQGLKVLYIALGDLKARHFFSRISAQLLETWINKTLGDSIEYHKRALEFEPSLNNLEVFLCEADTYSARDMVDYLKKTYYGITGQTYHEYFDAIVIDYDSNFYSTKMSLYEKQEEIYNCINELKGTTKIILIGSQTSRDRSVDKEFIGMDSLAESSRKTHICDMIITLTKNNSKMQGNNTFGTFNLAKNRDGSNGSSYFFLDKTGKFIELNYQQYSSLILRTEVITYSHNRTEDFEAKGLTVEVMTFAEDVPRRVQEIKNNPAPSYQWRSEGTMIAVESSTLNAE